MIPSLSVVQTEPSRRRNDAPALSSPPKPIEPSTSPSTNHLKPTGTSTSRRPRSATTRSIIDDETRVLPTPDVAPPLARPAEQVGDHRAQDVVRVEQPGRRGDHAVAVRVGVIAQGDVESITQGDQPGHRRRRRRVHPDLAVPVVGHEPEARVDRLVGDGQVQAVALGDGAPVRDRGAAHRIHADAQAGRRDGVHVDDRRQLLDVGAQEVVAPGRREGRRRPATRRTPSRPSAPLASRIRLASSWIQRVTSVSAGPPLGGLYLKPPSSGGLCEGVTTMPSARCRHEFAGWLATMIARDRDGVGV